MTVTLGELPTEQAGVEKSSGDKQERAVRRFGAGPGRPDSPGSSAFPPTPPGVVVTKVARPARPPMPACERGDVIQEVNRKPVQNTSDFERAMRNSKDETLLLVNRQGSTMYVAV